MTTKLILAMAFITIAALGSVPLLSPRQQTAAASSGSPMVLSPITNGVCYWAAPPDKVSGGMIQLLDLWNAATNYFTGSFSGTNIYIAIINLPAFTNDEFEVTAWNTNFLTQISLPLVIHWPNPLVVETNRIFKVGAGTNTFLSKYPDGLRLFYRTKGNWLQASASVISGWTNALKLAATNQLPLWATNIIQNQVTP